ERHRDRAVDGADFRRERQPAPRLLGGPADDGRRGWRRRQREQPLERARGFLPLFFGLRRCGGGIVAEQVGAALVLARVEILYLDLVAAGLLFAVVGFGLAGLLRGF